MHDPVAELLFQFGIPITAIMMIGCTAIAIGELKKRPIKIRYHGKTFVRKYKDEIDKIEKINRNEGKV